MVMEYKYDFVVVGSGLFGSTIARLLKDAGKKVLVVEKRNHIGGNVYTETIDGIIVHKYGAHIFHTSNEEVWKFVNKFASFNNFVNSPLANYHGEMYHLPFNMNTFVELWPDVKTPEDAQRHIESEKQRHNVKDPSNLEEQAISLVGETIYKKLIKEYTEKQWGRPCSELPASIIKRIPVRFTFDNNYFNDKYQGIPIGGYTKMVEKMLSGIDLETGKDFLQNKEYYFKLGKTIIFTGPIDEYYDYCFGNLEYRSLKFINRHFDNCDYQKNAVVNYTSHEVPYTRIIEHKYFDYSNQKNTIITEEYPDAWELGKERFYTVNNDKNNNLLNKYNELAKQEKNVLFGGRLGSYKYYDMDDTIEAAMNLYKLVCSCKDS